MAHNFDASDQQSVKPYKPQPPAAISARLPHGPTPRFWLRAHPRRWQCIDGEWLPILGTIKLDPGVGGVDRVGNTDHAELDSQRRGWVKIPWDCTPDGELYIDAYPCEGGTYHCTRWEMPRQMAGRILPSKVDSEGYHAWLRWLIAEGKIPSPDPDVVEVIQVEQQRKTVQNLAKDAHKPGVAEAYQAERARLEEQEAAVQKLRAPKRSRKAAE